MVKHEVSKGQALVDRLERFIGRYVHFADAAVEGQALVCAVWVLHTWLSERFTTTPYLAITASTKQAGKTLLMEVLGLVCRGSKLLATVRPLMICRMIEAYEGRITCFFDEAEVMGKASIGDSRALMASGYRAGGVHGVTVGTKFMEFPVYCPKAFALIGDLQDILRDRAIVVQLERGKPEVDLAVERGDAEAESAAIRVDILGAFVKVPEYVQPEFLTGRDREIWAVLWSIVMGLGLEEATVRRFERAMVDLCGLKSAPRKEFHAVAEEANALDGDYAERAMRDLRAILREGEKSVVSGEAVERMKGIATGPWRTFEGRGLDVVGLARLVGRWGVKPRNLSVGVGRKERKILKGYTAADIKASVKGGA